MSKKPNLTLQHFADHFLTPEASKSITTLGEVLTLPLSVFKDLNQRDAEMLAKIDISTIHDLGQLMPEGFESCINKTHLDPTKLQRIFVACKLVFLASQKQLAGPTSIKKSSTKVIFVGLDNAGKSSLINLLSGKNLAGSVNLEPTTMVNHVNIALQDLDLIVWDFGGQESYRQIYLQNPEEYLTQVDLIIYVIDSLDTQRFDETLNFFSRFLDAITNLKEHPYLLVLLHKGDPDIQSDPEFQINLEYLHGRLREVLRQVKFKWEIVTSSIYNSYHTQPIIAGFLKDTFNTQQINEGNIAVFDAMVKMNEVLVQIDNKLMLLEDKVQLQIERVGQKVPKNGSTTIFHPTPLERLAEPIFPPPPGWSTTLKSEQESISKEESYKDILKELQEMFKKRGLIRG